LSNNGIDAGARRLPSPVPLLTSLVPRPQVMLEDGRPGEFGKKGVPCVGEVLELVAGLVLQVVPTLHIEGLVPGNGLGHQPVRHVVVHRPDVRLDGLLEVGGGRHEGRHHQPDVRDSVVQGCRILGHPPYSTSRVLSCRSWRARVLAFLSG
jgi:hypothetical protein